MNNSWIIRRKTPCMQLSGRERRWVMLLTEHGRKQGRSEFRYRKMPIWSAIVSCHVTKVMTIKAGKDYRFVGRVFFYWRIIVGQPQNKLKWWTITRVELKNQSIKAKHQQSTKKRIQKIVQKYQRLVLKLAAHYLLKKQLESVQDNDPNKNSLPVALREESESRNKVTVT